MSFSHRTTVSGRGTCLSSGRSSFPLQPAARVLALDNPHRQSRNADDLCFDFGFDFGFGFGFGSGRVRRGWGARGMSDYSLLLPLRARCQGGAEEAQTSFPPDGVGSSLTLELELELGKGQGQGAGAEAGHAKRGGLFRNRIYEKHDGIHLPLQG